MSLQRLIEQHWQYPKPWLTPLLWPLSRLFQAAVAVRRLAYRRGWLQQQRLPCPLVVVGNVHVGGSGKTPLTAALATALRRRGVAVGIVSRGYGRRCRDTRLVNADSCAAEVGDEPLMLHRQTGVPVAVGRNRFQAAQALLAAHPHTRLLIADDGLQHYALARDMEIGVFPAAEVGRRLDLLPNGGLREPFARLRSVDALVVSNGRAEDAQHLRRQLGLPEHVWLGHSRLEAGRFYRLTQPQQTASTADFAGRRVAALAAIARPERFFATLRAQGLTLAACKTLPDHAVPTAADLPSADVVVVTEKDAAKLAGGAGGDHIWVLPVRAHIEPDLAALLCDLADAGRPAEP